MEEPVFQHLKTKFNRSKYKNWEHVGKVFLIRRVENKLMQVLLTKSAGRVTYYNCGKLIKYFAP